MTNEKGAEEAVDAALGALNSTYDAAVAAIEALPAPQRAFERATSLLKVVDDDLVRGAADLRARMANRIKEAEKLSLAGLAERISVSKGRADQFVRSANAQKELNPENKP